jgi:hypothetical protein
MDLDVILRRVLVPAPPEVCADALSWWTAHTKRSSDLEPIDAAIAGGVAADRLAWAFASGYAAALRALLPAIGPKRACVAATEDAGAHPRAIRTTLDGNRVRGKKQFVTLGAQAEILLVVAKSGEKGGRPVLRVVRVDASSPGVTIVSSTAAPFVPEIEHAQIDIDTDGEVLEGDGYDAFLKPFRTIEDVHVHTALLAHVAAIGSRSGWARPLVARLCALIACGRSIATSSPRASEVHVALGGMIAETEALLPEIDSLMDERWKRDRALLGVAGKARAERFARAFERLSGSSRGG